MSDASSPAPQHLSLHRIEALTDGIYAVAMTLLVIDLKLPEHTPAHGVDDFAAAVLSLAPKFLAWFISFFVMAFFWMGHQRSHSRLRHSNGQLSALDLAQLAFISLMPFSCALQGEHQSVLAQAIFSSNMVALSLLSFLTVSYIYRHPELASAPMPRGVYLAACLRVGGLIVVSVLTVVIEAWAGNRHGIGNMAFMLMAPIGRLSRRLERATDRAAPDLAPG